MLDVVSVPVAAAAGIAAARAMLADSVDAAAVPAVSCRTFGG